METKHVFKVSLCLLLLLPVFLTPHNGFANTIDFKMVQSNDFIITIDNKTSDKDLEDIKTMLEEHGVTATFSKIKRNENKELTGIRIALEDSHGSQTISEFSSNRPLTQVTFGIKEGLLFINKGDKPNNNLYFFGSPDVTPGFPDDSIFGQNLRFFNFQDFFDKSNDSLFLKEHANIKKLMEQMQQGFYYKTPSHSGRYKFIDNPNLDKLIIIDGKESNFEKLNRLAETDQLEDVETLNPKIAMSIYGDKAKDGAIVALTKK